MSNNLHPKTQAQVIAALVEGNSLRSTVRMTGVHRTTIQKLLERLGYACSAYQDEVFQNLPCKRLECDEIWSFVGAKNKNATELQKMAGWGDAWTWVALCADTKLVPSWHVGNRDGYAAKAFIDDLAGRLANRVQLTTDGHHAYLEAVSGGFGSGAVDFAQLVKIYGDGGEPKGQVRYSPMGFKTARKTTILGCPDEGYISTSYVERQNLTMRMGMRRFTRLTNGFSKKLENHCHAISLHYIYYNFCRVHQTLRTTPAMAAGVSDRVWSVLDVVGLLRRD
ncbi:IS1 family transposase [Luteolibacter marinus]|uniref:IS1 family transposase n=1 Tax=Luteolibacter marinus TaxID=2776705 RepID=UPI001868F003|nr:IS1 family transposase [Luteolibacter marinus]